MFLKDLQDALRQLIRLRVESGQLHASSLARDAGFDPAHINNFLHLRRGLSIEAFDKLLMALHITLYDLEELSSKRQTSLPSNLTTVPLAGLERAHFPLISPSSANEQIAFRISFLNRLRPATVGNRQQWTRFIAVSAGADAATALAPLIRDKSDMLVDRHYNSLEKYRPGEPNLYLVHASSGRNLVRYLQLEGDVLLLRPLNLEVPLDTLIVESGHRAEEYILGRICHIGGVI